MRHAPNMAALQREAAEQLLDYYEPPEDYGEDVYDTRGRRPRQGAGTASLNDEGLWCAPFVTSRA